MKQTWFQRGCRVATAFLLIGLLFVFPMNETLAKGENAGQKESPAPQAIREARQGEDLFLYDRYGQVMKNNAWVEYKGKYYFPSTDGKVYRHAILHFNDTLAYYVNEKGERQNGLVEMNGSLRYFYESGEKKDRMATDQGWVWSNNGWLFINEKQAVYHDQFLSFGPNIRYYLGADGTIQEGLVPANGTVYRMTGEKGALLQEAGAYTYEGKWYFADAQGEPYRGQIISFGEAEYLMGEDGSRQDGQVTVNGEEYIANVQEGTVKKIKKYDFLWPVSGRTRLSSHFGWRWGRLHKGVDIPGPWGTPIRAAHDATVLETGYQSALGNYIKMRGDDGYYTNYFHLSEILVSDGQYVREGERIGLMGSTGNSTGSHLHFEVRTGGSMEEPHDPLNYSYNY